MKEPQLSETEFLEGVKEFLHHGQMDEELRTLALELRLRGGRPRGAAARCNTILIARGR